MKFVHLSDLHLGKRVNEFSMLEDQAYILKQILELIRKERPDAVLLAGDIYDKAVPSAEAVQLFDEFLYRLSGKGSRSLSSAATTIRRKGSPSGDGSWAGAASTSRPRTADMWSPLCCRMNSGRSACTFCLL